MSPPGNHNKLIDQFAKQVLKPLGCTQKGKSRLWFDDHGWWVGVIEFQPSSWSRGSYLNAGAMWLWSAKDHWTFDDGYRVDAFRAYKDDEQFAKEAAGMAERAAQEVRKMRQGFSSIAEVARHLVAKRKVSIWDHFHAAVAAGLAGDAERALSAFEHVAAVPASAPWVGPLQAKAAHFACLVSSAEALHDAVAVEIADARTRLKLPPGPETGLSLHFQ